MNTKSTIHATHTDIHAIVSSVIPLRKIKALVARLIARVKLLETVLEERQQLSRMSPEMLADIGLDAEAARQEYVRRYFDLPGGRW